MDNMMELTPEQMKAVSGGTQKSVNTGVAGLNAALRAEPKKASSQIGSIPNGTYVDVNEATLTYDSGSRRNFVYVTFNGRGGWIAASFVGRPR